MIRYVRYSIFDYTFDTATGNQTEPPVYRLIRQGVIAIAPDSVSDDEATIAALKLANQFYPGNILELEYIASRAYISYGFDGQISKPVFEPKG